MKEKAPRLRYLFEIGIAIGLTIGSLPGCQFTDGKGEKITIGHELPPVHVDNHVKIVLPEHRHLLPWRNKPKPNPENGAL